MSREPSPPGPWATSFAQLSINLVGLPAAMLLVWRPLPAWPVVPWVLFSFGASLSLAAFVLLRRHTWTVRDARLSFLLGFLVLAPTFWVTEDVIVASGVPAAAFEPHRLAILVAALVAPLELGVGLLGILLWVVLAAAQYATFPVAARTRVFAADPSTTVIYGVLGVILLEHRVRQLRAERAAAAARAASEHLERFGRLAMAVRDRTGGPLQVLALDVDLVRRRSPELREVADRMAVAIARLQALTTLLDRQSSQVPWSRSSESFDAEQVIARLGAPEDSLPPSP